MRLLGLTFSVIAILILAAAPAMAERRLALVIGNSSYRNTPDLLNPKNDANEMAKALDGLGFKVIRGIDLSVDGMRRIVREFADALQSSDVALFYYAGHGLQVNGQNYLVPVDAKMRSSLDLEFEATNLQVVIDLMEREAKTNLVFLDACRDNPLARTLARSLRASRSTTIGQGLARIESGIGTLIAYATEPGNVALDGDGRHSPFTEALLKHIRTPGLEVGRMLRRVRRTVLKKTNGKQVPWEHTSLIGDFYFGSPPAVASARPPAPPKPAAPAYDSWKVESKIWESIKQSRNPTDFESYLKQYPKGAFAPWARTRIVDLKRERQLAMRPPPSRAKPSPPAKKPVEPVSHPVLKQATPADKPRAYLSEAAIMLAVLGNTIKFRSPTDGEFVYVYHGKQGYALVRRAPGTHPKRTKWFFNDSEMLCRHNQKVRSKHCMRVAFGDSENELEFSNPYGARYQATILQGLRLHEDTAVPSTAMPGTFLSKSEIRKTLIGNTLKFKSPRNGQDMFVYFTKDGTVDVRGDTMTRTVRKVWFFNKLEMMCRTIGPDNRNHCVRIERRDNPAELDLSNSKAGVSYQAVVLKGRQLPE